MQRNRREISEWVERRQSLANVVVFSFGLLACLVCSVSHAAPSRPVVFVPGILGSQLFEGNERLWGGASSYNNFVRLDLPLDPVSTSIEARGVIESFHVLGLFEVHQYDILLDHLRGMGYQDGKTLFVFSYDWRQSNFTSAARFAEFVERTPVLNEGKFDFIGHSMGGIVGRIFLSKHDGAEKIRSFVTLGTPHRGSLKIHRMLLNGFEGLGNFLAGGAEKVRATAFTFPSVFELLPSGHRCCILGSPADPRRRPFDILDRDLWFRAWIPTQYRMGPWGGRLAGDFAKARELRGVLSQNLPPSVHFYAFAGDHIDTLGQVYVDRDEVGAMTWKNYSGDGSVIVASAAAGDIAAARVSFSKHSVIFKDRHVLTALGRILAGVVEPVDFSQPSSSIYITTATGLVPIDRVGLSARPVYSEPGATVSVQLEIKLANMQNVSGLEVEAELKSSTGKITPLRMQEDEGLKRGPEDGRELFVAELEAPRAVGTHTISVRVPGLADPLDVHFVVLPGEEHQ